MKFTACATAILMGAGLMANLTAGDACCPKGGKKPMKRQTSLEAIKVGPAFKSKEEKLSYYRGIYSDISHKELLKLIEKSSAVIIDVNRPADYQKAHVTGAVNFYDVQTLADALPEDKSTPVIAYCGGPKCGAWIEAARFLTAQGYTNVKHYSAGIKGWLANTGKNKGQNKSL
ncbi:MAG: hypothetical protein GF344_15370 [Chitinivibrionales bacterium]|nr:hypothetical protein [Chitinivibrionales bacterium]MBD3358087.1 hypothetical protein [Chitinivibrionales bacterium]